MILPEYPESEDLEIEPGSLFPVAFIERLVNICAGSPIHSRGHPKAQR
jgi:hypothetical protein